MRLDLFVLIRPSQESEQKKESWAVNGRKDKNVDYITIIYHIWNISVPSGLILIGQLGSRPPSFVSVAQVVLVVSPSCRACVLDAGAVLVARCVEASLLRGWYLRFLLSSARRRRTSPEDWAIRVFVAS